jgi:hypothetical protein
MIGVGGHGLRTDQTIYSLPVIFWRMRGKVPAAGHIAAGRDRYDSGLRDRPADREWSCMLTPYYRAEDALAYQSAAEGLERARRVWARLNSGLAGRAPSQRHSNHDRRSARIPSLGCTDGVSSLGPSKPMCGRVR